MLPQQIIDDVEADNEYFAEWHSDWLGYYGESEAGDKLTARSSEDSPRRLSERYP
jgi:hypothetical protein